MSILENLERLKSAIISKNWDDVCDAYHIMTGEFIEHIEADTEIATVVDCIENQDILKKLKKEKRPVNIIGKKRGRPKKVPGVGTVTKKQIQTLIDTQDEIQELEEVKSKLNKDGITTTKKESRSEPVRFKGNTFVDDGKLHSDERGSITGIAKVDAKLKKTWKKEKARQAYKPLVVQCSSEKCPETLEIDPGLYYSESNHYCNKCLSKKRVGNLE